jgi:LysR family transcriptional regulator, benzoate and cis,cis-muconate-responsive activator of ben and cat genes
MVEANNSAIGRTKFTSFIIVALLPRSASRLSHIGILFKPISDRLLWIETSLFLRQDQRDERLRWFVPELLLQIKNATLDR